MVSIAVIKVSTLFTQVGCSHDAGREGRFETRAGGASSEADQRMVSSSADVKQSALVWTNSLFQPPFEDVLFLPAGGSGLPDYARS